MQSLFVCLKFANHCVSSDTEDAVSSFLASSSFCFATSSGEGSAVPECDVQAAGVVPFLYQPTAVEGQALVASIPLCVQ